MDTNQIRKQNLRKLVSEHEGMNKLASRLGLKKGAYISQLLTDPPVRTISEKTARSWEQKLGLPGGWMDGGTHAAPVGPRIDAKLLTHVMLEVTAALRDAKVTMATEKLAELVALQYADAQDRGVVDPDRLKTIIGLIKG